MSGYLDTGSGRLAIDGADAIHLSEEHGTPLYVFSEKRIAENVRGLRKALETVHP